MLLRCAMIMISLEVQI